MKYSLKVAGFRSLLGVAWSILPFAATWAIAKGYTDEATAGFIAAAAGVIFSALGVDHDAYKQGKKRLEEDLDSSEPKGR